VQYVKFNAAERQELMRSLSAMPEYLYEQFDALSAEDARCPTRRAFSPVEQVWHLADLEREGFSVRIRRLRDEQAPRLPDFDGDRIARERPLPLTLAARRTRGVCLRSQGESCHAPVPAG